MESFISTFGALMDFDFLEGPFESLRDPEPTFVKRGVPGPYRGWQRGESGFTKVAMDFLLTGVGDIDELGYPTNVNEDGLHESVLLVRDTINKQEVPYDGLLSFSQG